MLQHNKVKTSDPKEWMVNKLTILSFQQFVDDTTEVHHLRGSRDGEWNIIYQIPTEKSMRRTSYISYKHSLHLLILSNW